MQHNELLAHKIDLVGDEVKDLRTEFRSHMNHHQRVDKDMKDHGERIVAMESVLPDLKTTLGEVVKSNQMLNNTIIRIDEETKANTTFRMKFTWKEITALTIAVLTIISLIGQYWGGV